MQPNSEWDDVPVDLDALDFDSAETDERVPLAPSSVPLRKLAKLAKHSPEDAEALALAQAQTKQASRDIERSICERYVYNEQTMDWYDIVSLICYPEKAFNRLPDSKRLQDLNDLRNGTRPRTASVLLLPIIRRVDCTILIYGAERLLTHECAGIEKRCLNLYAPALLKPAATPQSEADVRIFVDHIRAICSRDPATADVLLDWMSWVVQNPSLKVRWAPLIYSTQGIGKDTMLRPLTEIIGTHNCVDISPADIEASFNQFDACKLIVLNEMLNNSRYSTYDRLKPKISGTGSGYIQVNPKYERPYSVKNVSAWVVFTNHPDAMPMEEGDRRFYVLHGTQPCSAESKAAYFTALHDWLTDGGTSRLFRWMLDRDVSRFNPHQPPADTAAKAEMRWEGMTDAGRWLASACTAGSLADRTIVTRAEVDCLAEHELIELGSRKVVEGLRAGGFESIGVHPVAGGSRHTGKKTTFYSRGVPWGPTTRDDMLNEMGNARRIEVFGIDHTPPSTSDNVTQLPRR